MPKNVMCDCVSEPSFGTEVFGFLWGASYDRVSEGTTDIIIASSSIITLRSSQKRCTDTSINFCHNRFQKPPRAITMLASLVTPTSGLVTCSSGVVSRWWWWWLQLVQGR